LSQLEVGENCGWWLLDWVVAGGWVVVVTVAKASWHAWKAFLLVVGDKERELFIMACVVSVLVSGWRRGEVVVRCGHIWCCIVVSKPRNIYFSLSS
jgi:hypothetical protein